MSRSRIAAFRTFADVAAETNRFRNPGGLVFAVAATSVGYERVDYLILTDTQFQPVHEIPSSNCYYQQLASRPHLAEVSAEVLEPLLERCTEL